MSLHQYAKVQSIVGRRGYKAVGLGTSYMHFAESDQVVWSVFCRLRSFELGGLGVAAAEIGTKKLVRVDEREGCYRRVLVLCEM